MKRLGFIFFDDSDIIADAGYANNLELTVERMQTTIDSWEWVAKITVETMTHVQEKIGGTWFTLYGTNKGNGHMKI